MRSKIWFSLVVPTVLTGCMMLGADRDGHDCPMCDSDDPLVKACSKDSDCGATQHCSQSLGRCEWGQGNPGAASECAADSDCPKSSYCEATTKTCVEGEGCASEADCALGFNCDASRGICLPAALPTCGEVQAEAECLERSDCAPLYAGVDCSCGPDCSCKGGEPGCVCAAFEFFRCVASTP